MRLPFTSHNPNDLILGNRRPGTKLFSSPYQLPNEDRQRHLYCLGVPGTGKSSFLLSLILQDIKAGRGVGVLDPHSDLVRAIFNAMVADPELRPHLDRVDYIDISQDATTTPFNILAMSGNYEEVRDLVIGAFKRTWKKELEAAPQFTNIMQNTLPPLIQTRRTLMHVQRMLTDKEWREQVLAEAGNRYSTSFFHDRFDRWRDDDVRIESTLNKVNQFVGDGLLRRSLGQSENHIDLRKFMDTKRIVLVDLQRRTIAKKLFGSLLMILFEHAAFGRSDTPPEERIPFHLYVDEFASFTADEGSDTTLSEILSQVRKYGLYICLAHQSLSQIQGALAGAIDTIGTKVLFGTSYPDAKRFAEEVGKFEKQAIKGEPKTDTQHPIYESLQEQQKQTTDDLYLQESRRAIVASRGRGVVRIQTLPVMFHKATEETLELRQQHIARNSIPSSEAEHRVQESLFGDPTTPQHNAIPAYEIKPR